MNVFGIAGFKNSGKTTLVVALVRELSERGFRVATVKHAHHAFDIDHPGKDSFQHRAAGAQDVIVASARRWAHIHEIADPGDEPDLDSLLQRLSSVDLVLVEGYKHGTHPRLEVRRAEQTNPVLASTDPGICAVVCDAPVEGIDVPQFGAEDIPTIADFILDQSGVVRNSVG